jgi:hypothetical protein
VAPILGALLAGWLYSTYFASPLEKEQV